MTLYVVDSSVVVKWFVPEPLAAEANRVRERNPLGQRTESRRRPFEPMPMT
jgi:hypothetical protein